MKATELEDIEMLVSKFFQKKAPLLLEEVLEKMKRFESAHKWLENVDNVRKNDGLTQWFCLIKAWDIAESTEANEELHIKLVQMLALLYKKYRAKSKEKELLKKLYDEGIFETQMALRLTHLFSRGTIDEQDSAVAILFENPVPEVSKISYTNDTSHEFFFHEGLEQLCFMGRWHFDFFHFLEKYHELIALDWINGARALSHVAEAWRNLSIENRGYYCGSFNVMEWWSECFQA